MLTLSQLEYLIEQNTKQKKKFKFQADNYIVQIDCISKIYISAVIENLDAYLPGDKTQRLIQYIQRNSNAIGYIYSTLAYDAGHNVIVHRWLSENTTTAQTMLALNDILQHADILSNTF